MKHMSSRSSSLRRTSLMTWNPLAGVWSILLALYWLVLGIWVLDGIVDGNQNRGLLRDGVGRTIPRNATKALSRTKTEGTERHDWEDHTFAQRMWRNQFDVVHTVHTRFMQLQPHLIHLGRARLDLFRTITLPSMMHQTTSEFLWIIRTDPNLDGSLLRDLCNEVLKLPNAVLIASNQNDDDIRHGIKDVTRESVLAGSYDLIMSYHEASLQKPRLETRLDADDALSSGFLASLQARVAPMLSSQANQISWITFCSFDSLEWQLYSPFDGHSKDGLLICTHSHACVTPGLTYLYEVNATKNDLPTQKHHKLSKTIPPCQMPNRHDKCLQRIAPTPQTCVLRARTPTSAGMSGVLPNKARDGREQISHRFVSFHEKLWRELPSRYGVSTDNLVVARSNLLSDLPAIVDDALLGQCTKHHSCKQSSKMQLKKFRPAS